MNAKIEKMLGAVRADIAKYYTKGEFLGAIQTLGEELYPGETPATQIAKAAETEIGGELYSGYCQAKPDEPAPQPASAPSEVDKALSEIHAEAGRLMHDDATLTESQAIGKACEERPDLYGQYRAAAEGRPGSE
ncbi:MAG: hypothetical protein ABFD89_16865 [Bryobacteraceae bacterium]